MFVLCQTCARYMNVRELEGISKFSPQFFIMKYKGYNFNELIKTHVFGGNLTKLTLIKLN